MTCLWKEKKKKERGKKKKKKKKKQMIGFRWSSAQGRHVPVAVDKTRNAAELYTRACDDEKL